MRFLRFLLFLALGIGAAVLVELLLPTRTPKVVEQPAPPPAVKSPEPCSVITDGWGGWIARARLTDSFFRQMNWLVVLLNGPIPFRMTNSAAGPFLPG